MENLKEVAENLVHLNIIMKSDCPIKIETPKAHDWLINFLVEFAEKAVKNCTIPDVINRRELLIDFLMATDEVYGMHIRGC